MDLQYLQKMKLPSCCGVYFFLGKNKKPLYIGKATELKSRVRSYFAKDLINTRGPLLVKMLEEAKTIEFRETGSVLEALLLEADLIKKFKPPYNTQEKDDKSFNCVVLTKEDFPKLLVIRKKDIDFEKLEANSQKLKAIYGPFTNGFQLQEALKLIRKIFPYRDAKCILPKDQKLKPDQEPKPCFNYTIGLCPGTCIGIEKKSYAIRVRRIEKLLSGNVKAVVKDLEKDMHQLAKEKKFEAAKIIRDKIYALQHVNDISLIKSDFLKTDSQQLEAHNFRIESYDIAHMSGDNMVGVMTVVEDGMPNKSQYRKFKINTVSSSNDPKALREVLGRRLKHAEWTMPDIIVVDGSTAQINAANEVILTMGLKIPVVAVVKDSRHKAKGVLGREDLVKKYKRQIILANAESHRFAIAFHKKRRSKDFLPEN